MEKLKRVLINKKYIIGIIVIYVLFVIQMQNVFFYGDDYDVLYPVHDEFSFENVFKFCINKVCYYWNNWSGRIIGHFMVSFFLSFFGLTFFRFFNPIMIFSVVFLSLKIFNLIKKINVNKFSFYLYFILLGVNIYISRETLYWGYSTILYIWGFNFTLLTIYIVYKNYIENTKISIKNSIILIICSIIQTFILEQISFVLISFYILMLCLNIKNKKNCTFILFLLIISLIGFSISALSPGNVDRTKPLVVELEEFTTYDIIIGKWYNFFNIIFNPELYGKYWLIFLLILSKKYFGIIKKDRSFLKKIPFYIINIWFIMLVLDKILPNLNIIDFSDSLDTTEVAEYPFIRNIFFTIYIFNIIYVIFYTLKKEEKFLFYAFVVCLVSSIIPVICIRYIGTRYYLYLFFTILLLCVNYILDLKKDAFDIKSLILFLICLNKEELLIVVPILIISYILFWFKTKNKISIYEMMCMTFILILTINIIEIYLGYYKNAIIYRANEELLLNPKGEKIYINEIPYEDFLYSWHAINLDYNINIENVFVIDENGNPVQMKIQN